MTFSVKVRRGQGPWQVYHGIEAESFRDAEKIARAKAMIGSGGYYSINDFDAKAYRSDAKSVWRKK